MTLLLGGYGGSQTGVAYYDNVSVVDLTAIGMENHDYRNQGKLPFAETENTIIVGNNPPVIQIFAGTDIHLIAGAEGNEAYSNPEVGRYFHTSHAHLRKFTEIANQVVPDCVLFLGDVVDTGANQDFPFFKQYWESLISPKYLVPGNHDTGVLFNSAITYPQLLDYLGYAGKPINAGSEFNQSFVVSSKNGRHKIRVILFDSQRNENGEPVSSAQGLIADNTILWLKNELENSPEKTVIIGSHHGLYMPTALSESNKSALIDAIKSAKNLNAGLKVTWIYGHYHVYSNNKNNQYEEVEAVNIISLSRSLQGEYTVINVDNDYNITFDRGTTEYPYY